MSKVKAEYVEKLELEGHPPEQTATFECMGMDVEHPYNGIGVTVERGHFGISERDGGIEVMKNGKLFWSSVHGYYDHNEDVLDAIAKAHWESGSWSSVMNGSDPPAYEDVEEVTKISLRRIASSLLNGKIGDLIYRAKRKFDPVHEGPHVVEKLLKLFEDWDLPRKQYEVLAQECIEAMLPMAPVASGEKLQEKLDRLEAEFNSYRNQVMLGERQQWHDAEEEKPLPHQPVLIHPCEEKEHGIGFYGSVDGIGSIWYRYVGASQEIFGLRGVKLWAEIPRLPISEK